MKQSIFRRTFTRYLVSYILCFLLPVGIFSLFYTTSFLSTYNRQTIEKLSQSLDYTFRNIDLKMDILTEINYRILTSNQFSNSYLNETPVFLANSAISAFIRDHIVPNDFIHEIMVFNRNSQVIFSSQHMLSLDSFMRFGLSYPDIDAATFMDIINSAADNIWIPETRVRLLGSDQSLLSYIIVFPHSPTHSDSTVIILLRRELLDRTLHPVIHYNKSTAAIIDSDGQIIYTYNPSVNLAMKKFPGNGELNDGQSVIKFKNEKYFVYTVNSTRNQLRYVSLIPYSELTGEIQRQIMVFVIILLGLILCGSLIIFFLMQTNYKPIRDIFRHYAPHIQKRIIKNRDENTSLDEIELIRNTLEDISEENRNLTIVNEKYLREELLFNLIKGKSVNHDSLKMIGLESRSVQYSIVIFHFDADKSVEFSDYETLLDSFLSSFPFKIYLLEYLEKNSFIGIVS